MGKYLKIGFFLLAWILTGTIAYSTHLKAGEITATRKSATQYQIQLTLYTDSSSVVGLGVDEPFSILKFSFGLVDTFYRDSPGRIYIGNKTFKNVYTKIISMPIGTHTISYQQDNRNSGVKNMDNSGNTPFYLETIVRVSPALGLNNSPSLLIPPVDLAAVGKKYTYNPGAYDPEGDSLSFEWTIPKQNTNTNVVGYEHPNIKPVPAGIFTLDPVTGDIVWDAPAVKGYYNFAFIIKEWRNGQVIGYIVRDMQIEVKESINKPPVIKVPADTCIVVGQSFVNIPILATDPDVNDKIKLSSKSGLYTLPSSFATFVVVPAPPLYVNPVTGYFSWTPTCSHIRDEPYQAVFIAEDITPTNQPLFDVKSWNIKVLAPQPSGLAIKQVAKGFELNWDPYACTAAKMEIFRKECDSTSNGTSPCEKGDPSGLGFKKIGEVAIGTTSFRDTVDLNPGSFYTYTISALFPAPKGGRSVVAKAVVGDKFGSPVPFEVTVLKTDEVHGKIRVSWTQPKGLDVNAFPGPYQYRLMRTSGIAGTSYTTVKTLTSLADTVVIDSMLNTQNTGYKYRIDFYYSGPSGLILKNSSIPSSSVLLTSVPGNAQVSLEWTFNVAWNNKDQYHRIYRKRQGENTFTLHDSVLVTGNAGSYLDIGLANGDTVCYYIQTQGEYCASIFPDLLLNNSQIICEVPKDNRPPCPPTLFGPSACIEDGVKQLKINWIPDRSSLCNPEIKGYNVYYAEHEGDELELLASNVPDTFFVDNDDLSLAGCYAVTALNYYGNESGLSNKICVDLCVYYELPNLISPNRDSLNDVFVPYPVPKNVKQVKFTVFNRWGKRIYYSEDDIYLNWKGTASDGSLAPSGVYFYDAEVIYRRRLREEDQIRHIKGWVHVIRRDEEDIKE